MLQQSMETPEAKNTPAEQEKLSQSIMAQQSRRNRESKHAAVEHDLSMPQQNMI